MAIETNTIKDLEFGSFVDFPSAERGVGKLYVDTNGFLRVQMAAGGSVWNDAENWVDGQSWTD